MPYKPKRPCTYLGCGLLVDNEQYCAEHKKTMEKHYNKYERDPATNKRYGRSWKRIRDRYIKTHPLCEECQKDNTIVAAEENHIHPSPKVVVTKRITSCLFVSNVTPESLPRAVIGGSLNNVKILIR